MITNSLFQDLSVSEDDARNKRMGERKKRGRVGRDRDKALLFYHLPALRFTWGLIESLKQPKLRTHIC